MSLDLFPLKILLVKAFESKCSDEFWCHYSFTTIKLFFPNEFWVSELKQSAMLVCINFSVLRSGPTSLVMNLYQYRFFWGKNCQREKLTTPLLLVPRLRVNGAVFPLPQYAFLACTGIILLYFCYVSESKYAAPLLVEIFSSPVCD